MKFPRLREPAGFELFAKHGRNSKSEDGALASCGSFLRQLLWQTAAWPPASLTWMVSLQAEITTRSEPPQQALLYLQNKKLLGLERGGGRDPAENHPLARAASAWSCRLQGRGQEAGSSCSRRLAGVLWSRLEKCPPLHGLTQAHTAYACSWLPLLTICVRTSSPEPGEAASRLPLAVQLRAHPSQRHMECKT